MHRTFRQNGHRTQSAFPLGGQATLSSSLRLSWILFNSHGSSSIPEQTLVPSAPQILSSADLAILLKGSLLCSSTLQVWQLSFRRRHGYDSALRHELGVDLPFQHHILQEECPLRSILYEPRGYPTDSDFYRDRLRPWLAGCSSFFRAPFHPVVQDPAIAYYQNLGSLSSRARETWLPPPSIYRIRNLDDPRRGDGEAEAV